MANNRNAYREKTHPALTVLYIIVVLALIAAIVFMYMNWLERQQDYEDLVRQASESEVASELEARRRESELEEDDEIVDITPEPTAAPTAEPAQEPAAAATAAPEVSLPSADDIAFEDADFEDDTPDGFRDVPVVSDELADGASGDSAF